MPWPVLKRPIIDVSGTEAVSQSWLTRLPTCTSPLRQLGEQTWVESKSSAEHPGICVLYARLHWGGRLTVRGVKSAREMAFASVAAESSTNCSRDIRSFSMLWMW